MSNAMRRAMIAVLATVSLTGLIGTVRAAELSVAPEPTATPPITSPNEDKWVFNSPMYFWLAGLNGNVTAKGRSVDVSLSASDILQHMDIGFQGYFELAKPRYGIYLQPTYMQLSADGNEGSIKADLTTEMWIVEFAAFYKFWEAQGEKPASLAVLAGGRYWSIHNDLSIKDPDGKISATESGDLFDPIIGLRAEQYFTKKVHLWVQGDIGGFGLSNSQSEFSWQVLPLLGYDFTMPVIHKPSTVFAGYRILGIQKSEGSGDNEHGFNLRFNGVLFGLNVVLF